MIRLSDVHYRYPASGWVLKGIDLSIDTGEYVFVCGASGSGKSTLGYLFNGLIPHFFGGTLEGSVEVAGADTKGQSVSALFSQVGLVLQNADAQLFNSTVEDEIAFGLESLGLPSSQIEENIRDISKTLQIEDLLNRSPMALSGGEKRLVTIACVLCLNPALLVLDEPYAHLDWEGVRRVREALW
ncbi:MAG: ABC transporter ATP-binding protein, partial [Candidatus Aminicenantes bacterium]